MHCNFLDQDHGLYNVLQCLQFSASANFTRYTIEISHDDEGASAIVRTINNRYISSKIHSCVNSGAGYCESVISYNLAYALALRL